MQSRVAVGAERAKGGELESAGERLPTENLEVHLDLALLGKLVLSLRRLGFEASDCEDAVQDALLELWRVRDRITPRSPGAWLYAVARRMVFAEEKSRRCDAGNLQALDPGTSVEVPPRESWIDFRRQVGHLNKVAAAAIWLRYAEGCELREIATRLGVSPANAKKLLQRGMARLRRLLRTH